MIDSVTPEAGAGADVRKNHRRSQTAATLDRLPPHSLEAEQGVLGCVFLSPQDCLGEVIEKFKSAGEEVFYDLRHQAIFRAMVRMFEGNAPIDTVTVAQWIRDGKAEREHSTLKTQHSKLDAVGGLAYLSSLPDAVPSAANLSYYAEIVFEKYVLRRMIQTCTSVVGRAYEHEGEVDALMDQIESDILKIADFRLSDSAVKMKDLVKGAVGLIQQFFESKGALTGLATGFVDLDKMTSGLQNGDMIVIAARPSLGKTSLAMNIAEHVALNLEWIEETEDEAVAEEARKAGLRVEQV